MLKCKNFNNKNYAKCIILAFTIYTEEVIRTYFEEKKIKSKKCRSCLISDFNFDITNSSLPVGYTLPSPAYGVLFSQLTFSRRLDFLKSFPNRGVKILYVDEIVIEEVLRSIWRFFFTKFESPYPKSSTFWRKTI